MVVPASVRHAACGTTMNSSGTSIETLRIYDAAGNSAAARILVDRLWPRGFSRERLRLDDWIPEVAPTTGLRKWFQHDRAKWPEFETRYRAELAANAEAVGRCLAWCRKGPVRLLYSTRERELNHAVVLRRYLETVLAGEGGAK